jgi:hypothetical protein
MKRIRQLQDFALNHGGEVLMVVLILALIVASTPLLILYAIIPALFNPHFWVGVATAGLAYVAFS